MSYIGIPDMILDPLLVEHPEISGISYALEIRSFGRKGLHSRISGLYSLEYSRVRGEGTWRVQEDDLRKSGWGRLTQYRLSATLILSVLPGLVVHPYFGLGIGIEKAFLLSEGSYADELGTEINERFEGDRILPVLHLPLGLSLNFDNRYELRIEGGFKNGFYLGAGLQVVF